MKKNCSFHSQQHGFPLQHSANIQLLHFHVLLSISMNITIILFKIIKQIFKFILLEYIQETFFDCQTSIPSKMMKVICSLPQHCMDFLFSAPQIPIFDLSMFLSITLTSIIIFFFKIINHIFYSSSLNAPKKLFLIAQPSILPKITFMKNRCSCYPHSIEFLHKYSVLISPRTF